MYKHDEKQMIMPHEFFLPFGGKLNPENRWCKLALLIPWDVIEDRYARCFKNLRNGNEAVSARMAFGSLFVQNRETLSDKKLLEHLTENPYMQYFIGLQGFTIKPPFVPSLLVEFRKRLGADIINEINELIAKPDISKHDQNNDKKNDDNNNTPGDGGGTPEEPHSQAADAGDKVNAGKLILDATCTPAYIHFPTDISLLNDVREALEEIVDVLHEPYKGVARKPRTYRDCARKDYIDITKKKRPTAKELRKAIGQQLRYVRRDLAVVDKMLDNSPMELLSKRQYRNLLVSQEIYRQQSEMYRNKSHKIEDRIVSLSMPFVRPIVRGKANAPVEFGAKLSVSIVDGYTYMENVSFDAYNEGITLKQSVERYYERFGCYPEAVIGDKIFRTRGNSQYCKEHGIRLSGPPLGRPPTDTELRKEQRRQERDDTGIRNAVEGKFGEGKQIYGLGRVMARLQDTSIAVIALQILVMNLERRLRVLIFNIFRIRIWAFGWAE